MKIDINGINNKVKPQLNNSNKYLSKAADIISSLNVPKDFSYYKQLKNMSQDITDIDKNVKNINKWVSDVANKFQTAERKNSNTISSLLSQLDKTNFASNIGKTGSGVVGVATHSMALGQNNITTFEQKGLELAETITNGVQNGINSVGAKISSTWDSLYNKTVKTGKNFFENCKAKVSDFVTGAINEISNGINKIKDGITTFAKEGWEKIYGLKQNIENGINSVGAHISSGWDSFCTEIFPDILDLWMRTTASIINLEIGIVKGLFQFAESLVDLVVMLLMVSLTVTTGLIDAVSGIMYAFTGMDIIDSNKKVTKLLGLEEEYDKMFEFFGVEGTEEFDSITAFAWKKTMGFVAEDWVGNAYSAFYQNSLVGQAFDEMAFDIFKSDGIATEIASGIGEVAGIILLTVATAGVGDIAVAPEWISPIIATLSGTGKYTEESWENMRDSSWEGIERMYEKGEITEDELNTYKTIRSLTDEQWSNIEKDHENGIISQEEFEQIKRIRDMPEDWTTLENGVKGILYGVSNGVWEGVQWYVGGELGGWTMKNGSKIATSIVRVGADTTFNVLDTPLRTVMDAITYGKTWDQAWKEQGGWQSVLTNMGIGLIGSVGGEIFDGIKPNKVEGVLNDNQAIDIVDESKKFIDDFNNKFPDSFDNGARKLQDAQQVAEYFSDPKGFLAGKFGVNDIRYMTDSEIYKYAKKNLGKEDFKAFDNLYSKRRRFSKEEKDFILAFAAAGGPAIEAYCRGVDVEFRGHIFEGGNYKKMNDYFHAVVNNVGASSTLKGLDIDGAVNMLDNIIENSKPLTESLILTRYVDGIFNDGNRILNPQAGMIFNDKAFLSTSASGGTYANRNMRLEIEVPAGSKVAYIEPEAIAHTGFRQQEVLLGRNNMYQITDVRYDINTGQYIIKAKMIPVKSSFQSIIDYNIGKNDTLYYTNYSGKSTIKQIDLANVISDMESKGLMAKFEAEIRDMKMSRIYSSSIAGHGEEHIEDVIFNAMYIAENKNFSKVEKKILVEAAKYHDAGKGVEGRLHGIQGAENAKDYLSGFSDDDVAIIQAIIEYHSIPDSYIQLNEIFDKYNVAPADRDMAEKLANVLKDADALDRSRYPGNLDEKYLRTDIAKTLVKAFHQLQEIKGKQFLDNYLSGKITDTDRAVIEKLRKNGISDYEITFWKQYSPSEVGGVIGVWNKVNNKIKLILGG